MTLDPATADRLRAALATVVAIPVTPFGADGAVDWDTHASLLRRLVDAGVSVVTPNGNTGEFYTLAPDERRWAVESTIATVGDKAEVLVGIGLDVASAIEAGEHARAAGARMVMVHQPVHPYLSTDGWVEYHRVIADALPDLGIVLYVRDPRINGGPMARLCEASPNIVGVKYAVHDPAKFAATARDTGQDRVTWLAGLAELSAPGYWAVGARGFTSGLVNIAPALSLELLESLRRGDFEAAMKTWQLVRPIEELRAADSSADNVGVVKEALAQLGLARRDVRPPGRTLPEDLRAKVADILRTWGTLD